MRGRGDRLNGATPKGKREKRPLKTGSQSGGGCTNRSLLPSLSETSHFARSLSRLYRTTHFERHYTKRGRGAQRHFCVPFPSRSVFNCRLSESVRADPECRHGSLGPSRRKQAQVGLTIANFDYRSEFRRYCGGKSVRGGVHLFTVF